MVDFDPSLRAYIRLPFSRGVWRMPAVQPGATLFVDIPPGRSQWERDQTEVEASLNEVLTHLRDAPVEVFLPARTIVIRWPFRLAEDDLLTTALMKLASVLRRRLVKADVALLVQSPGALPLLVWHSAGAERDGAVLADCRRAELDHFLTSGHALWRPNGYHYKLPSGRHAGTFVRTADALIDPRAAGALATWLYPDVTDATNVVLDHGGLAPIAQELRAAAERYGTGTVLRVVQLDEYLSTSYQFRLALKGVESQRVIALVSVSSTGTTVDRLSDALRVKSLDNYVLHPLVARGDQPAYMGTVVSTEEEQRAAAGIASPWTTLQDPPQDAGEAAARSCTLCMDPKRAPVVHIDPTSMRALLLPSPHLQVPDLPTARSNRGLWERYALVAAPERMDFLNPIRSPGHTYLSMNGQVFFEPVFLVGRDDSPDWIRDRATHLATRDEVNGVSEAAVAARASLAGSRPSVIVIDEAEFAALGEHMGADRDRAAEHVRALVPGLAHVADEVPVVTYHDTEDYFDPHLPNEIGDALVVAFGVRTGVTLQRTFLSLRSREVGAPDRISALVVHAHPVDPQIWAGIRNTFRDANGCHVLALYLSYLPDTSPLFQERRLLEDAELHLTGAARTLCAARVADPHPQPLWGPQTVALRPTSFLGERLPASETLAAVGSAMQAARVAEEWRSGPTWEQFNLQRAFKSYFDGLILACILRWTHAREAFWGEHADSCQALLEETSERFRLQDWEILLPELLLAAAQGKVPRSAHTWLMAAAEDMKVGSAELTPWLDLGIQLMQRV